MDLQDIAISIFQSAPDGILVVDPEGRIRWANRRIEELFGVAPDALRGRAIESLVPARFRGAYEKHREANADEPDSPPLGSETALWAKRDDGSEFPVEIDLRPLEPPEGGFVMATIRDVTDRNRPDDALRESEARFRGLMEAAPNGMLLVDADGRIALANRHAESIFGYAREELVGESVEMLVPERFRDIHPDHLAGYFADPKARPMGQHLDLWARRRDGEEIRVEISLSPLQVGEDTLAVAAVRDVRGQHRQQQKLRAYARDLERSNRDLEMFAHTVSHDLAEPMRTVAGFVQLLAKDHEETLPPAAHEYMRHIIDGVGRMGELLEALRSYSRVGSRGRPFEPVPLGDAVAGALRDLRSRIEESGATVTHDDLPVVEGDRVQLRQMFQNLVDNAIKFRAKDNPQVRIWAVPNGAETWKVCVQDNGIGIPAAHQEQIFAIFRRLRSAAAQPGTGLGLALCKRIAERHGGTIDVESDGEAGSTFHITLPAAGDGNGAGRPMADVRGKARSESPSARSA